MEHCAEQYGEIFTVKVGPLFTPQVFISNPEAIQEMFATDPKILDSGAAAGIRSPLLGEQSMLTIAGEPHRRQRKLLTPPLHGERMTAYGQLICEITRQATAAWEPGTAFTALPFMQAISFDVILRAVFGLQDSNSLVGQSANRAQALKVALLNQLNPPNPLLQGLLFLFPVLQRDFGSWSPWAQFLKRLQAIDALIYAEIEERRSLEVGDRSDILSLMMAARDEAGAPMSDVELRDELMTLLIAGHETTATVLAWAMYWIHALPDVQEKLLQELQTLGDDPDPNVVFRLPYLNAVCQETLRIYPVAMLALNRVVKAPFKLMGYEFAPGTLLVPCIYLTHHREDLYPQPNQFNPDRFLERSFSPSEYIPFGGGNRRCIGMAFALFEMKLVLATLLSHWNFDLANDTPVPPVRGGALLRPKGGVQLIVKDNR
jgi:unspecific monooxygenase